MILSDPFLMKNKLDNDKNEMHCLLFSCGNTQNRGQRFTTSLAICWKNDFENYKKFTLFKGVSILNYLKYK